MPPSVPPSYYPLLDRSVIVTASGCQWRQMEGTEDCRCTLLDAIDPFFDIMVIQKSLRTNWSHRIKCPLEARKIGGYHVGHKSRCIVKHPLDTRCCARSFHP
jgi:hypothetical protein